MIRRRIVALLTIMTVTMRTIKMSSNNELETTDHYLSSSLTAPYENFTLLNDTSLVFLEELHPCDHRNVDFNCSKMEFVRYNLGPQTISMNVTLPITVLYVVIFLTGVIGNMAVCIVIIKNPTMHSATNYYLFSLAVSDLTLLLFGLPNDLSYYWHQYPYHLGIGFCKLRALLSEATSYVSVLTIVAFSTERYLAICHPLHLYAMSGLKRAARIIGAIWIISLLAATPFFIHTTIHYVKYPPNSPDAQDVPESAFCAMLSQPTGWPLWEMSSILFFLLPAVVIMWLYARMGLKIRSRHGRRRGQNALNGVNGSVHGEARQSQSRKAILRMLAAVVIAFFVCWAPFHAQRLIYIYGKEWEHYQDINEWMFSITGWLYYVSSTVNPILYNVMSNRYRVAFRETLCCGRKMGSSNGSGLTREHSSFRETSMTGDGSQLVRVRSVVGNRIRRAESQRYVRHSSPPSLTTPHHVTWQDSESLVKLINVPQSDPKVSVHKSREKKRRNFAANTKMFFNVQRKMSAEAIFKNGSDADVTVQDGGHCPSVKINSPDPDNKLVVKIELDDLPSPNSE